MPCSPLVGVAQPRTGGPPESAWMSAGLPVHCTCGSQDTMGPALPGEGPVILWPTHGYLACRTYPGFAYRAQSHTGNRAHILGVLGLTQWCGTDKPLTHGSVCLLDPGQGFFFPCMFGGFLVISYDLP